MTANDLNIDLEKLQSECVNNGGIFEFLKLPIQSKTNFEELLKKDVKEEKLTLIHTKKAKEIITESIDHWSLYSGPSPERNQNSKDYDILKVNFIDNLFHFLDKKGHTDIYRIENLDSWINEILQSGIDHINEDFFIQTNHENYILHLGFSS